MDTQGLFTTDWKYVLEHYGEILHYIWGCSSPAAEANLTEGSVIVVTWCYFTD